MRCPDCGEGFEAHNAVNRVPKGLIAHSGSGGACWRSLNTTFTKALRAWLEDDDEQDDDEQQEQEPAADVNTGRENE